MQSYSVQFLPEMQNEFRMGYSGTDAKFWLQLLNEKQGEYDLETQMFIDYEKHLTAYKGKFYLMF